MGAPYPYTKAPYLPLDGTQACKDTDLELFFPDDDEPKLSKQKTLVAKKICRSCNMTARCLEYAIAANEVGIWGGTTTKERRYLKNRIKSYI